MEEWEVVIVPHIRVGNRKVSQWIDPFKSVDFHRAFVHTMDPNIRVIDQLLLRDIVEHTINVNIKANRWMC